METKELIEFLRSCGKRGCEECQDVECCTGPGWLMLKAADRLEGYSVEKIEKVIAGLKCCRVDEDTPCENGCPYDGVPDCVGKLMEDAYEVLEGYHNEKVF